MAHGPLITVYTQKEWRMWLQKHHDTKKHVCLVSYKKHTGKPSLSHREAMDEALCFGWIDTTIKRLDDERYRRCFVKRTEKSRWSKATLSYAKRLLKEGRMAPAGLKRYKEGLKKPVIDHSLPRNPDIPYDLKKALQKSKKAHEFFMSLAPSYTRLYIYLVLQAKLPETRKKRIRMIVERCKERKKPGVP